MTYSSRLKALKPRPAGRSGSALAGAGQMGRGFVAQVQRIAGHGDRRHRRRRSQPRGHRLQGRRSCEPGADGSRRHTVASPTRCSSAEADVDVVVDATGRPRGRRRSCRCAALRAGKHVGLLNVECDVTVG